MKFLSELNKRLFLAATGLTVLFAVWDVFSNPITAYIRIAAPVMLAISIWIIFGHLAVRNYNGPKINFSKSWERKNKFYLLSGATLMTLSLGSLYLTADYISQNFSFSTTLLRYFLAMFFCGGFALVIRSIWTHITSNADK